MSSFEARPLEQLSSSETAELAVSLPKLVSTQVVRQMLDVRHHWTAQKNLSNSERTAHTLDRIYLATNRRAMWMEVYYDGNVRPIGVGTLIRNLSLRRLMAPIPPFPGLRSLCMADASVGVAGSNATAWIDPRRQNSRQELQQAYIGLTARAAQLSQEGDLGTDAVWTIEPNRAQVAYGTQDDLRAAGMVPAGQGYYDDGESNWHPVLKSGLFISSAANLSGR